MKSNTKIKRKKYNLNLEKCPYLKKNFDGIHDKKSQKDSQKYNMTYEEFLEYERKFAETIEQYKREFKDDFVDEFVEISPEESLKYEVLNHGFEVQNYEKKEW